MLMSFLMQRLLSRRGLALLSAVLGASVALGGDIDAQKAPAVVATDAKTLKTVRFKHHGCGPAGTECRLAYSLDLEDGESFTIEIDSTLPDNFIYTVAGIPAAPPDKARAEEVRYVDTSFVQRHDKKFGGYLVTIRHKGEKAIEPDATLLIGVRTTEWQVSFAGGFPVSTLVDRTFALKDTVIGTATQYKVVRQKDHEDKIALSTATFVHLRRNGWQISGTSIDAGLSFGLGISSNTTYFIGPSALFGQAGALTIGAVFGSRADLPTGINVDQITSSANALANAARRNAIGFFAGFSYSFLGSSANLEKPFKGADAPPGTAQSSGARAGTTPSDSNSAKSSVALSPSQPRLSDTVTFTITVVKADGGTDPLLGGSYTVRLAAAADSALAELYSPAADMVDPQKGKTDAGKLVQGRIKGKMKKAVAGAVLNFVVVGSGHTVKIASDSVTVKN